MFNKKPQSKFGKFLMGIFVGSAVGSIVGVTLAPRSGRELRGKIAKDSKKTWNDIKAIVEEHEKKCTFGKIKKFFSPTEITKPSKESPKIQKDGNSLWHRLNKLFIKPKAQHENNEEKDN